MFYLGPFPGTIHRESASRLTFQVRHVWIRFQDPVSRVTAQLLPFPKGKMYTKAYQYQAVFYGTAQSRYCPRVALMRNHDLYGLRAHVFYIELPFVAARYMNQQKQGDYQERIKTSLALW